MFANSGAKSNVYRPMPRCRVSVVRTERSNRTVRMKSLKTEKSEASGAIPWMLLLVAPCPDLLNRQHWRWISRHRGG